MGLHRAAAVLVFTCALGLAPAAVPGAGAQEIPAAPAAGQAPPPPSASPAVPPPSPAFVIETDPRPGLPARAAALIMSGQQGGAILVSALAVPLAADSSGARIGVVIDIDGPSLLAGQTSGPLPVEVSAYAMRAQGGVSGHFTQEFTLDAARAATVVGEGGIKLVGTLTVVQGPHTLRVLVRNPKTSAFGLTQVSLGYLPAAAGQPFAGEPVVAEPEGAWLLARERGAGGSVTPYPFVFDGAAVIPSTRPILRDETPVTAWVVARGLPAGDTAVRILDASGEDMGQVPATVTPPGPQTPAGTVPLRVEFTLPRLYPGRYTLALAPAAAPDAAPLTPALEFEIVEPAVLEKAASWARLRALPGPEAGAPPEAAPRPGKKPPSRELEAAYRAAIEKIATTRPAEVRTAVMDLERRSAAVGTTNAMLDLVAAEIEVAGKLARVRPESTLGLFLLHADLFRAYGTRKQYILQAYSRRTLEELIDLAVRIKADAAFKALVADAVAIVGSELQQGGLPESADRFYRRALELDPTNGAALMGIEATAERTGKYRDALRTLETMVEAHPDDTEARLRLAVNLARASSERRANAAFRRCLKPDNPVWVRAVAYQELAEALVEKRRYREARTLLETATAELPHNQRLAVQLAYVLDRLGDPLAARKVADGVAARPQRDEESPRLRYSDWPRDALAAARARLGRGSTAAMDTLRRTVAGPDADGAR